MNKGNKGRTNQPTLITNNYMDDQMITLIEKHLQFFGQLNLNQHIEGWRRGIEDSLHSEFLAWIDRLIHLRS